MKDLELINAFIFILSFASISVSAASTNSVGNEVLLSLVNVNVDADEWIGEVGASCGRKTPFRVHRDRGSVHLILLR